MTRLGLTAAVLAAGALICSSAIAETITFNVGFAAGGPAVFTSSGTTPFSTNGTATNAGIFWTFAGTSQVPIMTPSDTGFVGNTSVTNNGSTPGDIFVWITLQGNVVPVQGGVTVESALTTNMFLGSHITAVTLSTFLDPTNGVAPPVGAIPLDTHTFTMPLQTQDETTTVHGLTPGSMYSLQQEYEIDTSGFSNANLTIDMTTTAIPEPASLGLIGAGLLGIFAFKSRK